MSGLSEILHKLWEHLAEFVPFKVVDPWESGLRVRLGRRMWKLGPGLHWKLPFIDTIWTIETNAEPFVVGKQTIDGVTFELVGVFRLTDVEKFYVEMNDVPTLVVATAVAAAASEAMTSGAWKGATDEMLRAVTRKARRTVRKWGIRIEWLAFRTVTDSPCLRLLTDVGAPPVVAVPEVG